MLEAFLEREVHIVLCILEVTKEYDLTIHNRCCNLLG